jgi:hypothetical protein
MKTSRGWQAVFTGALCFMSVLVPAAATVADEDVVALIQRRVRDWQPTRDERLLDQVGWASDLVEAKRLAKEHGRPLFVFTYSGSTTRANAIALQRC